MADSKPFVSVIIPAYNSAHWLPQSIDSVLGQTVTDLELLVVDDGSKDNTGEVVGRYVARDPGRVRYLPQPNGGAAAARNNGIAQARGDLIAFLDADDWWDPGKLAAQRAVMDGDPDVAAVFTDVRMLRDGKESANKVTAGMSTTSDPDQVFELIIREVCFPSTALLRKRDVVQVGCFQTKYKQGEDIDLWLRLAVGRKLCFMMQAMTVHRVVDTSLSRSGAGGSGSAAMARVYKDFLALGAAVPAPIRARARKALAQYYFDWGWASLVAGDQNVTRLFAASWMQDPRKVSALKWIGLSLLPRSFTRKRMRSKEDVAAPES
jgi:glycosyltransferase involved in cell wall biosynthesis